ncbi:MAG TPA: hypothetical protein PLQ39_06750 [Acinetobacter sp.]|nr:hypothetical protein [Acinetobacter sp.]
MTINKDLHNQVSVGVAIALTAVADGEDVVGAVIDRQGSEGLELIFQVGAYTDGDVTPLIEESDDNVTYTAVADANLTNTEASAALSAAGVSNIGYVGFKRYVRATAVTAAGSTLSVGASFVKFGLRLQGTVNPS